MSTTSADPAAREHERRLLSTFASTGDQAIRDELVERFMPLARSLAHRYHGGTEPIDDLFQVATVGLIKAIDGYDPERRNDFAAYASPTILGELRHYFRDQTWSLHLPRGLQERLARITDAQEELGHELRRPPTNAEISAHSGLSEAQVFEALEAGQARRTVSLDLPTARGEEESAPIVETLGTLERGFERTESQLSSESAGLRKQERRALQLRFQDGLTQQEIGERIGVSQMQVSRLLRRSLKKLLTAVQGTDRSGEAPTKSL